MGQSRANVHHPFVSVCRRCRHRHGAH